MATVLDVINRSLRLIGVKESGESLPESEANDAFEALNSMMDGWNTESLMIYNLKTISKYTTAGKGSYTIGPSGDFNTTRPQRIESALINDDGSDDGTDWNIEIIKNEQYKKIWQKSIESTYPSYLYYEPSYPLGVIKLYPVPAETYLFIELQVWNQIAAFTAINDVIAFPPGYERMIVYNLAVEIAPEYDQEASSTVQKIAVESKANIKIVNNKNIPTLRSPMNNIGSGSGGDFNIRALFNT